MKVVNVDDVLEILYKYGKYIFVTDEKRYSSMVDEIANLKALEQQPCEDCISRQEALNVVHKYFEHYLQLNDDICLDGLRSLPSVTPKEKTGWIPVSEGLPNMNKYKSGAVWERQVLATVYHSWDSHKELYITTVFAEDVIIGYHMDECIVAWMPLPAPFEPQESEDNE